MNITKITIGRLYNLGSYEHIRYELTAEVAAGESPALAIIGMEKILTALSPKTATKDRADLARERRHVEEMRRKLKEDGEAAFRNAYGHHFVGPCEDYVARYEKSLSEDVDRRVEWEAMQRKARRMLNDLGGAALWKGPDYDYDYDHED